MTPVAVADDIAASRFTNIVYEPQNWSPASNENAMRSIPTNGVEDESDISELGQRISHNPGLFQVDINTSESSPLGTPALSQENSRNKHDPATPNTPAEKQEYLYKLKAAFKNVKDCKAKDNEIKFIKEASDDKLEAWCESLLECIIRRQKKASSFFSQKQRTGCRHSKEYAKFEARFAAVEEILKVEKRACHRFASMPGKGWMDRLADDPIFEHDSIVLNDNGNTFRGIRDQNVRENNKMILEYLQRLGNEGMLAGYQYENILRLAMYNVAPVKHERESRRSTASKRKRKHDLDTGVETELLQLGSQFGGSRSNRGTGGFGASDADVGSPGLQAISSKRRKLNNDAVGPSADITNSRKASGRAVQNLEKPTRTPHGPSQHLMVKPTAGSFVQSPPHSAEGTPAENLMQRNALPLVFGAKPALGIQVEYQQSQKTEGQYHVPTASNPNCQHSGCFHQDRGNLSAMQPRNNDHYIHPSHFNNMHTSMFGGPAQSHSFPNAEESDAHAYDEFDTFINY